MFGEQHGATEAARADLLRQGEELKAQREERKSGLPVAELRRRAEKDRDTAMAKLSRTGQQLGEIQEQQQKLAEKADQLYLLRDAQEAKVEKLKQQVAEYAHDEAGNAPVAPASTAEKDRQAKEANDASKRVSGATAELTRMATLASNAAAEANQALNEALKRVEGECVYWQILDSNFAMCSAHTFYYL